MTIEVVQKWLMFGSLAYSFGLLLALLILNELDVRSRSRSQTELGKSYVNSLWRLKCLDWGYDCDTEYKLTKIDRKEG